MISIPHKLPWRIVLALVLGFVVIFANVKEVSATERRVEPWLDLRNRGVSFQRYDYSCGTASLVNLIRLVRGVSCSEKELLDSYYFSQPEDKQQTIKAKGLSLFDLSMMLKSLGYKGIGVKFDRSKVTALNRPMIVYLELAEIKHFAVLERLTAERAYLLDSSRGRVSMPIYKFFSEWNGIALLVDEFSDRPLSGEEERFSPEEHPFVSEAARRMLR